MPGDLLELRRVGDGGGAMKMTGEPSSAARHSRPSLRSRSSSFSENRIALSSSVNGWLRGPVAHELDRVEEPAPRRSPTYREVEQRREHGAQLVLLLRDVLHDPLALHDLDVAQRDRALGRVPAERVAVVELHARLLERRDDLVRRDDRR